MHNSNSSYWLNPENAGIDTCVSVHLKKCKSLFGKGCKSITKNKMMDFILAEIKSDADSYEEIISNTMDLTSEIAKITKKISELR
jgi:hypothetical protein